MKTETNSISQKVIVGLLALIAFGFVAPTVASASGTEPGYDVYYGGDTVSPGYDVYYGDTQSGSSPGYDVYYGSGDDCSYYGDCGGYNDTSSFDDCSYYGDCGGYNDYSSFDDCSYYGDCGGYNDYSYSGGYYDQPYYSTGSYYTQPYYTQSYNYTPPSYNYSSYDYSYDYVYDYEYTYEYEYDYCSNIPGNQSNGYDCYPDHHDECSNISGNQPDGYDCYPDRDEDISCELTVDDRTVEEGDEVTLEWDINGNANYASINQGIGRVDEDGGEEDVEVDEDTTFRLTVRNSHGDEDTCSVTVRVDDENNFSSVSFSGEPTYNPPVVYLSDIPYTGLEDIDPTLLSYWLMLIASAGAGVWFLYRKGMIPHFAFASLDPIDEGHVEEVETGHADVAPEVNAFLSAIQNGDNDAAVDHLRDAAANGTGVEEFLAAAESATDDADLQARVSAALEGAQKTGIRGAKEALA